MKPIEVQPTSRGLLQVYLFGQVDFEEIIRLQRGVVYRLSGEETGATLILCEHPPLITIGRHGGAGWLPILGERMDEVGRHARWVARGGGTILHLPGQLAIYPILPLQRLGLGIGEYLLLLQRVLIDLLDDFGIQGEVRADDVAVYVGSRLIASIGIALRQQISTFGAILNVDPDLTRFRLLGGNARTEYTSIVRERRGPLRHQLVRERLLEHFSKRFGFEEVDFFFPRNDQAESPFASFRR